jgi:hypothetical protein
MKINLKLINLIGEGIEAFINLLTLKQWLFVLLTVGLLVALLAPLLV